jgi:excisionase family DNA binding protein
MDSLAQSLVRIPKLAYSIEEACVISSLSRATLFRSIAAGELATVMDGRRRIVPRQDLQAFLERKRTTCGGASA